MIQFCFKTSKSGSRLHFILSLAGINPVMADSFVKPYLDLIGPLLDIEQNALDEIRKIINALPENDRKSLLIDSFVGNGLSDDKYLNKDSLELFNIIDNKFETYWSLTEKYIFDLGKDIENDLNKQKVVLEKGIKALDVLFDKYDDKNMVVYLVSSPINNISGKFISENTVYIEIPRVENFNYSKFWLLLLHEVIHASYEPFEYKMWLKKFAEKQLQTNLSKNMGPKNILRELIDSAISPNGYFANYLYKIDIKKQLEKEIHETQDSSISFREEFNYLKRVAALNLYDEFEQYIKGLKKIDEKILNIVWDIVLNKKI